MENTLDKQEEPHTPPETDESSQTDDAVVAEDAEIVEDVEGVEDVQDDQNGQDVQGSEDVDGTEDMTADETEASAQVDEAAELEIAATVEAILFSTDNPISPSKIAVVAELPGRQLVKKAIRQLNERYEQIGCAFRIESIAGGYQMLTQPEYHDVVSRLFKNKSDSKLSQAAMETLAIVAYRQPILRADIEAIRGVASGEMLRNLLDKNLAKIVGRAEVLGRPMLYGTTRRFLEVFGLNDIEDLPNVEALRAGRDDKKSPAETKASQTPEVAEEAPKPAQENQTQAESQAESQDEPQAESQNESQADGQDEIQEEAQDEAQDETQAEPRNEPQAE